MKGEVIGTDCLCWERNSRTRSSGR